MYKLTFVIPHNPYNCPQSTRVSPFFAGEGTETQRSVAVYLPKTPSWSGGPDAARVPERDSRATWVLTLPVSPGALPLPQAPPQPAPTHFTEILYTAPWEGN